MLFAMRFDATAGAILWQNVQQFDSAFQRWSCCCAEIVYPQRNRATRDLQVILAHTGWQNAWDEVRARIWRLWNQTQSTDHGGLNRNPGRLDDILASIFDAVCSVKAERASEMLSARFGFTLNEFIQGSYSVDGETREITDREIVQIASGIVTGAPDCPETAELYGNETVLLARTARDGVSLHVIAPRQFTVESVSAHMAAPPGELIRPLRTAHRAFSPVQNSTGNCPEAGMLDMFQQAAVVLSEPVGLSKPWRAIVINGSDDPPVWEMSVNAVRAAWETAQAELNCWLTRRQSLLSFAELLKPQPNLAQVLTTLTAAVPHGSERAMALQGYTMIGAFP